jgi:tetratricopeptide (TPR) repeat protein
VRRPWLGRVLPVALAVAAGLAVVACAKRVAPPLPAGEEYVYPAPAPGELPSADVATLQLAWREVQAGNSVRAAERYEKLLRRHPRSTATRSGLGYARLRGGELEAAQQAFATTLEERPGDVSALVGAGSIAARRRDLEGAVAYYRRAAEAAPEEPVVRKRLGALKLQLTEQRMAEAEAALAQGDAAAAAQAYEGALAAAPEVTGVRLALAQVLAGAGDRAGAIAVLAADSSGERQVLLELGRLLCEEQEYARALEVYTRLLAHSPGDEEARAGQRRAREGLDAAAMPEEYRAIPQAARVSRADLAALLAVRVAALRRAGAGEPLVAVDISGSWARDQVARVLALGIMDVYPNHTFQPGAIVRRVDLARAAARTLDVLRVPSGPSPVPSDMSRAHLDIAVVERVLAAGLMGLTPAGAFEPWRPVSGREAIDVVDAVARLAGP